VWMMMDMKRIVGLGLELELELGSRRGVGCRALGRGCLRSGR
jgi:hypothetical protein